MVSKGDCYRFPSESPTAHCYAILKIYSHITNAHSCRESNLDHIDYVFGFAYQDQWGGLIYVSNSAVSTTIISDLESDFLIILIEGT